MEKKLCYAFVRRKSNSRYNCRQPTGYKTGTPEWASGAPHLDGQYAAFGKITDNAQAAVDISRVNRDMFTDKPKKPQTIQSIRVDTQGVEYPAPEKH